MSIIIWSTFRLELPHRYFQVKPALCERASNSFVLLSSVPPGEDFHTTTPALEVASMDKFSLMAAPALQAASLCLACFSHN